MIKTLGTFAFLFLVSCASLHTPSPHFVPSVIKKNQCEGEVAVGMRSASVNFVYSPLGHFSVMGNVQGMTLKNKELSYQRNCEMALGYYNSGRKSIYGFNAGYGMGAYNWDYFQFNDSVNYAIHSNGNFQKIMVQAFFALTDNPEDPRWVAGFSAKGNFYWDQYTSLKYSTQQHKNAAEFGKNLSFEPCVFIKNFFTKKFYLNAQAGINISYDYSMFWPSQYVFTRIGLGLRI